MTTRKHLNPISKAEGDAICADVLRLVRAVLEESGNGTPRDRVMRDPGHDLALYGRVLPTEVPE